MGSVCMANDTETKRGKVMRGGGGKDAPQKLA